MIYSIQRVWMATKQNFPLTVIRVRGCMTMFHSVHTRLGIWQLSWWICTKLRTLPWMHSVVENLSGSWCWNKNDLYFKWKSSGVEPNAHCMLVLAFAHVCMQLFLSILLSKIITCQTLFIHNIGYLMCRDNPLEWNSQRNFPHCHSVVVKKVIIFDTAASSEKLRQVGLSGLLCLDLVLEAFCHFSTSCILLQRV